MWVLEGLFAVVWAPWFWELAEAIRSGEFVAELLRPGDPYLRLLAFDLGRTLSVLATRTVPTLTVAALLLPLRLPGTLGGLALLGASLVLAAVVSFQLRFLFGSAAFWTPDYRSLFMLVFPVLWLASGFVVPVDFFPGPLRALVDWSPLIPLLMAPVRVATGAAGAAVATQVAWVACCGWAAVRCWPWPAAGWWSTVAEHARVYLRLAAASVRSTARRPAYLAARLLSAALIVAIEVAGVVLMLDRFGSIGGWRPPEVLLLFGLAFTAQGLALVFGDTLEADKMSELVRRGTFDQVLTRPASPLGLGGGQLRRHPVPGPDAGRGGHRRLGGRPGRGGLDAGAGRAGRPGRGLRGRDHLRGAAGRGRVHLRDRPGLGGGQRAHLRRPVPGQLPDADLRVAAAVHVRLGGRRSGWPSTCPPWGCWAARDRRAAGVAGLAVPPRSRGRSPPSAGWPGGPASATTSGTGS